MSISSLEASNLACCQLGNLSDDIKKEVGVVLSYKNCNDKQGGVDKQDLPDTYLGH